MHRRYFWPLFLVSTSTIAFEVALLRYFAVTSWQAFGTMVIGIALIGFAVSGTLLTLLKSFFERRIDQRLLVVGFLYLAAIPLSLLAADLVPFNPAKMLNPEALVGEVLHLSLYFVVFSVPFFFAGLFTGLTFVHHHETIGKIYFFDLAGAGVGSLAILGTMFILSPFDLGAAVFVLAFLAFALVVAQSDLSVEPRWLLLISAAALLPVFLAAHHPTYQDAKPIRQSALAAGTRTLLTPPQVSPLGQVEVLSNATEKATLPLSDEFSNLVPDGEVPDVYPGLYVDGNRVEGLVAATPDTRFVRYGLYAAPYLLKTHPDVLLLGSGGGFGTFQAVVLGASRVKVVEANPFLVDLLRGPFAPLNGGLFQRPDLEVLINDGRSFTWRESGTFDLLQISDTAIASRPDENYLLTKEAFADDTRLLKPDGLLTVSVDITDNFFYALRLLSTLTTYHRDRGLDPAGRIVVLRSLFKMLFLVKNSDFTPGEVGRLRSFAGTLGFDAVAFPGITGREQIFNLAPYVPITTSDQGSEDIGQDATLANDQFFRLAHGLIAGAPTLDKGILDYRPSTDDRPYFFSLLGPDKLAGALTAYELGGLPQQETNSLVLYAQLGNVVVFAVVIVLLPLLVGLFRRRNPVRLGAGFFARSLVYFACLGLGFLLVEVVLIQKLALFLGEIIYSFTLVLASILAFAGLGSYLSERLKRPERALRWGALVVVLGLAFVVFVLPGWLRALAFVPFWGRLGLAFVFVAPLAVPMGLFFPLGLAQLTGSRKAFVPWAWSVNGAFSVVATVSARVLSQTFGFSTVLAVAAVLYVLAALVFPRVRGSADAD